MGIRATSNTKDHLKKSSTPPLSLVHATDVEEENELKFLTLHLTKPCLVDLTPFRDGGASAGKKNGTLTSAFSGRPALIAELAPILKDSLIPLASKSVEQYLVALRAWWRLFDAVEANAHEMLVVSSVAHITDLHRQYAFDNNMHPAQFSAFVKVMNSTRVTYKLKQYYWVAPERPDTTKHLPPAWQTDLVRHELKHRWFAAVRRWETAETILKTRKPTADQAVQPELYAEQERLIRNYSLFKATVKRTKHPRPVKEALWEGIEKDDFYSKGYLIDDMIRGFYPDAHDIRNAFFLCLATTGWNPAVFLNLDVGQSFLEPHPKDSTRFVLRGIKDRAGGTEQTAEGLFKSRSGAGYIISELMRLTKPLRNHLKKLLAGCERKLKLIQSTDSVSIEKLCLEIIQLRQGIRSPWLFVSRTNAEIQWLDDDNFSRTRGEGNYAFLTGVIDSINERQSSDKQVSYFSAKTFRLAYGTNLYRISGGSVYAVMKALGHRSVRTTVSYLTNTVLREEHRRIFRIFSTALWDEARKNGRVDPTILAKISRDGEVTEEQRRRLEDYRGLLKSRIGVGCLNPFNPPKHIAPDFEADGVELCPVQRCTLCLEHGVILPESLDGLCKRVAELQYIQTTMSVSAFFDSSFAEELSNTRTALLAFDQTAVDALVSSWEQRIASGKHNVIEFDGIGALG
jgi:hypothetical protein